MNIPDPLTISCILLAIGVLAALIVVTVGLAPLRRVARFAKNEKTAAEDSSDDEASTGECPKASVIVLSQGNTEEIREVLTSLTSQDYPDYEVIVVHEDNKQANERLAEIYGDLCPDNPERLRFCFFQPGSHSLSRRKLALTIGMKAASGSIAVLTTSVCEIPSERWLSNIMKPYRDNKYCDVVLGYTSYDFEDMPARMRPYRRFEYIFSSARWLAAAINGNAYRGDGTNLSYRIGKFFNEKGFGKIMQLEYGDDDVFVNSIAEGGNTSVVINEDARLHRNWGENAARVYNDDKDRYRFTSQFLPRAPFVKAAISRFALWIAVVALIAAALVPLPEYIMAIVAAVIFILMYIFICVCYKKAAAAIGENTSCWGVPFLWLWQPISDFFFSLRRSSHRDRNYTYYTRG